MLLDCVCFFRRIFSNINKFKQFFYADNVTVSPLLMCNIKGVAYVLPVAEAVQEDMTLSVHAAALVVDHHAA